MKVNPHAHAASRASLVLAGLLCLAFVLAACGPVEKIPSRPMPAGANYTGLWYSNFDDMRLKQAGTEVTGTFEYKQGGHLSGTLEGGVLLFDWVQDGDLNVGRRDVTGKGYFVISEDGLQIAGKWGYGDSRTNGGDWTADKATESY